MAKAKHGDTVQTHYTGRLDNGTVFDSSAGREPLQFTIGNGQIIPGFEQAVIGMNPGDSKTVTIPADQAYGPYRDDMIIVAKRADIPADINPNVGDKLEMHQPNGAVFLVIVTDISDTSVTLDANHPLAGKDLTFDLELVGIV